MKMTVASSLFTTFCASFLLFTPVSASAGDPVYVRFSTTVGNIDVELLPASSPKTVANFLAYVDSGAYANSLIHRSIRNFVFQGGGYDISGTSIDQIPQRAAVVGEHVLSNKRGTLAMALLNGPDTGTDQWFFNELDNSAALDGTADGGPFTAFGQVANAASLAVMDQLAAIPVPSPSPFTPPLDQIPLINYVPANGVQVQNLVLVNSITRLTQTFAAWQTANFTAAQLKEASYIAAAATPQGDGVPNLLKYLYDINPSRPMTAADRAGLPVTELTTISGKSYLTLTYRQNGLKTGITLNVQTSTDLKTWRTVASPTVIQTGVDSTTSEGDPFLQVQVPATGTRMFLRLNVTMP